jgi:glycosyltransferase involved in cell wall biosynthesis
MIIGVGSGDYLRSDKSPDGKDKWGGAGWARVGQYVPLLRSAGIDVRVGHIWKKGPYLVVEEADGTVVIPDIIWMQRLMHATLDQSILIARAEGQIVVNDIDDWYWGLDPRNAAYKASHPKHNDKENTKYYKQVVKASDLVVVSTPYLAKRVSEFYDGRIELISNYIDVARFNKRPLNEDTPELGWVGSTDHRSGDIELLRGIVGPLAQSGVVRLVHGGHFAPSPSFASKAGVPEEYVRTIPRSNTDYYPTLLDFDIGMVPLRDVPFNHAKSDIKGLEYAAAGIPFVSSDLPSYRELHRAWGGEGVILARRPKEWIKGIKSFTDPRRRSELSDYLVERVRERDIEHGLRYVRDLFTSL